jgi:hypothetical protein
MNEDLPGGPPRKKTRIAWILALTTLLILSAVIYSYYRTSQESVPSIKAIVEIEGSLNNPTISTIEFFQAEVPRTEKPLESGTHIPGIYLIAYGSRVEEGYYQPYTEWTSKDYDGKGTYELNAGFKFEPETGEDLKIQIKIYDNTGRVIALEDFFIKWEYVQVIDVEFSVDDINDTVSISDFDPKKNWLKDEDVKRIDQENLPGIYLVVENDDSQINYINSIKYDGKNQYVIRGYFKEIPKIGEILKLKLIIRDQAGSQIAQFPETDQYWNYIWY